MQTEVNEGIEKKKKLWKKWEALEMDSKEDSNNEFREGDACLFSASFITNEHANSRHRLLTFLLEQPD